MTKALSAIEVRPAISCEDIEAARALFVEYAEALDYDTCFGNFDQEMADFPGPYLAPAGTLLIARTGAHAVGVVGLVEAGPKMAEMKRLYVQPRARGLGVGRDLAVRLLADARRLGYETVVLETLPRMVEAQALYRGLGFAEDTARSSSEVMKFSIKLSTSGQINSPSRARIN